MFSVVELTEGRRVTNGRGDENIRFVVVEETGRFVVVVVVVGVVAAANVVVDVFIVVVRSMGFDDAEVVERTVGDLVVIFGM